MKKAKSILAILMSMAMVVTMTPAIAFAADEVTEDQVPAVEEPVAEDEPAVEEDAAVEDESAVEEEVQAAGEEIVQTEGEELETSDEMWDSSVDMELGSNYVFVGKSTMLYLRQENYASGINVGIKSATDALNAIIVDTDYLKVSYAETKTYDDGLTDSYEIYCFKLTGLQAGTTTGQIHIVGDEKYNESYKRFSMTVKEDGGEITSSGVKLKTTKYTYDGKAKTPAVVVKFNGKTLKKGTNYKVTYKNNKKAGTAYATVTGIGKYSGEVVKTFTIKKGTQKIAVGTATSLKVGGVTHIVQKGFTATQNVGVFTYSSSNTNVIKVTRDKNHNATVTAVSKGTAYVTVKAGATANLKSNSIKIKYTVSDSTPTGKIKLTSSNVKLSKTTLKVNTYPAVTVTYKGKTLKHRTDYMYYVTGEHSAGKGNIHVWGIGKYTGDINITLTYVK